MSLYLCGTLTLDEYASREQNSANCSRGAHVRRGRTKYSACTNVHRLPALENIGAGTVFTYVKAIMMAANVSAAQAMPKAARHTFGVGAVQNIVGLNMVQHWMGHARIETTAIYADVIGKEERALARRTWRSVEVAFLD